MSKKTLQEFIGHVRNSGLVLGSHFYVEITNKGALGSHGEIVGMYCESVNLPGINIATADIRIFGENRAVPYMPLYPDLNLTFFIDAEMKVVEYFENWTNQIVNRATRTVGYYRDYANDMNIYVVDKMGNVLYKLVAKEVFPKAVSDVRFDSGAKDVVKLDVMFAMKYWEVDVGSVLGSTKIANPERWVPPFFGFDGVYPDSMPGVYGDSFNSIINESTRTASADAQRSGKSLLALTTNGPLSSFGQTMNSLGQVTGKMSGAISTLSQGLSNIVAPVTAISNSMNAVSGVLGTLNTVTSALGMGTPFAKSQAALAKASGAIAVVSTMKGLPGALAGVGSSVSSVGAAMGSIVPSIGAAANGSKQIMDAVSKMGGAFSGLGSRVQEASGRIDSE